MEILGISEVSFEGKDGKAITGSTLYVAEPIPANRGQGVSTDRFFLSSAKLAALDFKPAVGMQIGVLYNKFGKVATIRLIDNFEIE